MVAELVAGEALAAQVTLSRHLRGSFFHSQVADAVVFVDFTATVRASGCLISDACISQQMIETGCTHEVSIAALETKKEKPTVYAGVYAVCSIHCGTVVVYQSESDINILH